MTRNKISNTTELQSEQVQICASFGIENVSSGIIRFLLAKRSCLISLQPIRIKAANALAALALLVWPARRCVLQRAVCRLAARIENNGNPTCSLVASELIRSVHPSWLGTNQKRRGHQPKSDWL